MEIVKRGMFPTVALVAGLCAEEADEQLRRAGRCADVGNRAVAFYLADMQRRGLYQELGYPSVVAYAEVALGRSRRSIRELLRTGLALAELKTIDAAFAEGALPWSKVRRIC